MKIQKKGVRNLRIGLFGFIDAAARGKIMVIVDVMPAVTTLTSAERIAMREQRLSAATDRAVLLIAKIESVFAQRTWLLAGSGAAFICGVVALVAGAVYLNAAQDPSSAPSYLRIYGITSIILIPILLLLARLISGSIVESYADGASDMPGFVRGRAAIGVFAAEACLWGPRMCLSAWKRNVQSSRFSSANKTLAAKLVAALFVNGEGMKTAELLAVAGDANQFSDCLAYLGFYDWIGIAKDGTRIWLASDRQRAL